MALRRPNSQSAQIGYVVADLVKAAGNSALSEANHDTPTLFHKVKNERSILALAISNGKIFAGTQGGEILIWSLDTFELVTSIFAHQGAVLALYVSQDGSLLFSGGGDAIVNVWSTRSFELVYHIFSTYDVGDVFCVAYSSKLQTLYLGAQNTSIQWYNLATRHIRPPPDHSAHPSVRKHRFFDSTGPGGLSTPRSNDAEDYFERPGEKLNIDKEDILQYAHFGYVYCMILATDLPWLGLSEEALISGGGDGSIKFWDLNDANGGIQLVDTLENGDNSILSMSLTGTFLYTGKLEGDVDVWDLNTGQLIQTVNVYSADVLTVQAAYGLMFTGGTNGVLKVLERYKTKHEWQAHEQLILSSAITSHKDKNFLVTGGNDDCVAVWDITKSTTGSVITKRASNEQLIEVLTRFISYRSVSANPDYTEDCRRAAFYLRTLLKERGAVTELLSTDQARNPVVYGRFKGTNPNAKRTLFYGHYDVVAAENKAKMWLDDPFALHGQDGYLYARGVSDNKGPILAALFAVADLVTEQKLENDVVFLIEGEEECGSRGFQETVKHHKNLLGKIDYILLANSYWLTDSIPCLTYGLRGVVHANIHVDSGREDLHSGVSGSWLVSEPLKDLTHILSCLSGNENRINLPGFYDRIRPSIKAEDRLLKAISSTLTSTTISDKSSEISLDSLQARWREPSLTIHNIKTSGSSNTTIIPHRASAALSLRLVPGQDALDVQKSLVDYLEKEFAELNTTNSLTVETDNPADPWLGDPENEIFQTLERAVVDVWGLVQKSAEGTYWDAGSETDGATTAALRGPQRSKSGRLALQQPALPSRPLYIREGGSIPAVRFLEKELGAPAAQLPCGQASDNAHLNNERLRVLNLYNSRKVFRRVFRELGTQ